MLTEVAAGVHVRQSEFCLSNAVVVAGPGGALLIDPGINGADLTMLADDMDRLGLAPAAGFATHPHWDHVLWHPRFGAVPRYATRACAQAAGTRLARLRQMAAAYAPGVAPELIGRLRPLPGGPAPIRIQGRSIRVIEHQAHAPGHAGLLLEDCRALVAGDMLSDVEIPLLDPKGGDPLRDYLDALDLLEATCAGAVRVVIPGHGSVATAAEIAWRIAADRAYLQALIDGRDPGDARLGAAATYGRDWLPEAHENNLRLVRRRSSAWRP